MFKLKINIHYTQHFCKCIVVGINFDICSMLLLFLFALFVVDLCLIFAFSDCFFVMQDWMMQVCYTSQGHFAEYSVCVVRLKNFFGLQACTCAAGAFPSYAQARAHQRHTFLASAYRKGKGTPRQFL